MPVIRRGTIDIDVIDRGSGPSVLLLHSSVSGNRQWSKLMVALEDRFRLVAPNLYGYGQTSPWPGPARQTLDDQATLAEAALPDGSPPFAVVGHSFGGAVAMQVARRLGDRLSQLVLLEPNPFALLRQQGRAEAYAEIRALHDLAKHHGAKGEWALAAPHFCDYWMGAGSWAALSSERRAAFIEAMPPNFHEWDAVFDDATPLADWGAIEAKTLLVTAERPHRPIAEIAGLLGSAFPSWHRAQYEEGGHMAPLTRPNVVNPIVAQFLDAGT